jgi:hypothetical protein
MKVDRLTYADTILLYRHDYERIHGIIEAYGGRIKDCKFNWENDHLLMFFEMAKDQREEFEKELGRVKKT